MIDGKKVADRLLEVREEGYGFILGKEEAAALASYVAHLRRVEERTRCDDIGLVVNRAANQLACCGITLRAIVVRRKDCTSVMDWVLKQQLLPILDSGGRLQINRIRILHQGHIKKSGLKDND